MSEPDYSIIVMLERIAVALEHGNRFAAIQAHQQEKIKEALIELLDMIGEIKE